MPDASAIPSSPPKALPPPGLYADRYDLIDAWRGLAALGVCVHHVTHILIGGPSVMLFFVISGYCIAASADACQRKGWGFKGFMWRRIRRIYPPYLLSIAFWSLTRLYKWKVQHGTNDMAVRITGEPRTWTDWLQNLTMTQWLSLPFHDPPVSYAATNTTLFVAAYWSLCYEEQFYLVMGLMVLIAGITRMSVLGMSMLLLAIAAAWNVLLPTTSYGFFIEYWSLFAVGVLVFHRLCRIQSATMRRFIDAGLFLSLVVTAYVRWGAGIEWPLPKDTSEEIRNVYSELAIALCFALVLISMRPFSERIASLKLFKPLVALGHITFSLYLIHQFNLNLMATISFKIVHVLNHLPVPEVDPIGNWFYTLSPDSKPTYPAFWLWVWFLLQLAGHITLASIFWYFCERPFLNKSIIPAAPTSPAASPKSKPSKS
jgi:peptidoglycan/LPS O-acetylase OafA/YrhL